MGRFQVFHVTVYHLWYRLGRNLSHQNSNLSPRPSPSGLHQQSMPEADSSTQLGCLALPKIRLQNADENQKWYENDRKMIGNSKSHLGPSSICETLVSPAQPAIWHWPNDANPGATLKSFELHRPWMTIDIHDVIFKYSAPKNTQIVHFLPCLKDGRFAWPISHAWTMVGESFPLGLWLRSIPP